MADWEGGTASDANALVRLLKGILEEYGVEHARCVKATQQVLRMFYADGFISLTAPRI